MRINGSGRWEHSVVAVDKHKTMSLTLPIQKQPRQ